MVYKLAQRNPDQGGGIQRSVTNADSYAWMANSMLFYNLLDHLPKPSNFKGAAADEPARVPPADERAQIATAMQLHLGVFDGAAPGDEMDRRIDAEVAAIMAGLEADKTPDDAPPQPPLPTTPPAGPPGSGIPEGGCHSLVLGPLVGPQDPKCADKPKRRAMSFSA
jgi:hypothetical protein